MITDVITKKEIEVIHNFVDVTRFNKKPVDAFRKIVAPNGEKIIVHASNFRKVKRVDDVVKVFMKIVETMPASPPALLGNAIPRNGREKSAAILIPTSKNTAQPERKVLPTIRPSGTNAKILPPNSAPAWRAMSI